MYIPDLLVDDEEFFKNHADGFPYWKAVHDQAIVHTRRRIKNERNPVIKERRPFETPEIQEYRNVNERQITREGYEKYLSKTSRIIKNSDIRQDSFSESLSEWIEGKPFGYLGEPLSLNDYALTCLLRRAAESPNELLIVFPYNKENPEVPPDAPVEIGGLPSSELPAISIEIISYDKITHADDGVLTYLAGHVIIPMGNQMVKAPFYYGADSEFWYRFEPYYAPSKDKSWELKYDLVPWYRHDTRRSLINWLCGEKATSTNGDINYLESYLMSYFEMGDEVVASFNDDQAVRVKYQHPISAITPTTCWGKGCEDGFIGSKLDQKCDVCNGEGKVYLPGPYGHYMKPESTVFDKDKKGADANLVDFYTPDLGIMKQSYMVPFDLYKKAKQGIGLDLLDGTGVESGFAKDLRLDDLADNLTRISMGLFSTISAMLYQVESILVRDPNKRMVPSIQLPHTLMVKDLQMLKNEAVEALQEDRYDAKMNYYRIKYRNDDEKIWLKEVALSYAYVLLLTEDEIDQRLAKGTITKNDLIKADFVTIALRDISRENDLKGKKMKDIFTLIDEYMNERNLLQEETPEGIIPLFQSRRKEGDDV